MGAAGKVGIPLWYLVMGAASSYAACQVPRHTHLGIAKVEVDGFGMSNVQDSIGFWREPGTYLR